MTMRDFIYTKKCLGKESKTIEIYKIRTMELNAEERLDEVMNGMIDSLGKPLNDPRITAVGKFLRKYWLDELPQLYNLSRGDIKLVGIRPRSENDWKIYPSEIMERTLRQKPGLLAIQYAFPYSLSLNDNIEHMAEYLSHWEDNPLKTDKNYLSRIVWNIIFNGARGH